MKREERCRIIPDCIGENEEESPWEPLHLERGLKAEEGAVTLFTCESPHEVRFEGVTEAERKADIFGRSMCCIWSAEFLPIPIAGVILALGPLHASVFGEAGWSKREARNVIFQAAAMGTPGDGTPRRKFRSPEEIVLIVAVGIGGLQGMFMPGVADHMGTNMVTHPVSPVGAA